MLKKAEAIRRPDINRINIEEYLQIDLELFEIFRSASLTTVFRDIFAFVGDRSIRIRTFLESASSDWSHDLARLITREHKGIIEALLVCDAGLAQQRVIDHLNNGEART